MVGCWLRFWIGLSVGLFGDQSAAETVRVPLTAGAQLDLARVVADLAQATGSQLATPPASVELPVSGRSRQLTLDYLTDALRPAVRVDLTAIEAVFQIDPDPANEPGSAAWNQRLTHLATRSRAEAERRSRYGFRARPSYRPNDPAQPTVCLIHGLNSTGAVFKHLAPALEAAGYGVVTYDFPYNRDLDETSADFGRDWIRFRLEQDEASPWVIVSHSMGALLARSYIESTPAEEPVAISGLLMLAPPNHGSHLAHGQTLLQTVQTLQSVRGERRTDPLAYLGDGLGVAADDLSPGSAYLNALNAHQRRVGVPYRIIAGDSAYLNRAAREQVESRLTMAGRFGGFGRMLAGGLSGQLDEMTDGLGDGCVSVASARLAGVTEFQILHANHLELIRAPLLFPDPGPIASLPLLLDWLGELTGPDSKPESR